MAAAGGPGGRRSVNRTAAMLVVVGAVIVGSSVIVSILTSHAPDRPSILQAGEKAVPAVSTSAVTPTTAVTATTVAATVAPPAPPTTLGRRKLDIDTAIGLELVSYQATGGGLQSLQLTLTSASPTPLDLTIPAGTAFGATSRGVQSMVVTTTKVVSIGAGQTAQATLSVACASMRLVTPGPSNQFSFDGLHSDEMVALVNAPQFGRAGFRVQQFAIWTLTDNPSRGGYVGLGTTGFSGSGPSDDELDRIRELFTSAGLDPARYRALR